MTDFVRTTHHATSRNRRLPNVQGRLIQRDSLLASGRHPDRRRQRVHRLRVLGARPEELLAEAALVEDVLRGRDGGGHAPLDVGRQQRAPGARVADAAARLAVGEGVLQPEHFDDLRKLRVGIRREELIDRPARRLLRRLARALALRKQQSPLGRRAAELRLRALLRDGDAAQPAALPRRQPRHAIVAVCAESLAGDLRVDADHPQLAREGREPPVHDQPHALVTAHVRRTPAAATLRARRRTAATRKLP
mmetsp:Transcript_15775/g.42819  ORF Transcript_15775/g.42819 Transcript_15775/m.42819 type:complete len:250 (-) Transcript_15775:93-842(-)